MFKIGDLVTRKKYGNDIIFKIDKIQNNTIYLKGVDVRLYADTKEDDLILATIPKKKEIINTIRTLKTDEYFYIPGTILHLDGDNEYLEKCMDFYKEQKIKCFGYIFKESEFKDNVKKGDEIDVLMPAMAEVFDYGGEDLPDATQVDTSIAKVKINKGKAFHFELSEVETKRISAGESVEAQTVLASDYTNDAVKQFAAGVDATFANLYTRAGHYLDDDGNAITLDADYAKEILAYMQAEFQRGDGKGHTNWIDGSMVCIVPPEYQFYLGKLDELKYVESGHEKMAKGYIGRLCGWDILVSNNIAQPEAGVFYPLFGVAGKTLAGGISSDLNTTCYTHEKNFNTCYKGYGLYGVGAPRADYLGTVKVKAQLALS